MSARPLDFETCPPDEALAALIERRLLGTEQERVEAHVASCAVCLDVVAATMPPAPEPVRVAVASASNRPRRVPAKRWRRWALAAGLFLVAGGALFSALQRPFVARLSPRIVAFTSRWLGTAFQAETVGVRLGGTPGTFVVTLGSVRIGRDLGMFATADEIGVTVALSAPLFGDPALTDIRLLGPTVELTEPKSGSFVWPKRERERALALLARATRIQVVDARLVMHRSVGRSLAVEHLNGGVERTGDGARLVLQGRTEGGSVDVVGTFTDTDQRTAVTIAGRDLDAATLPLLAPRVSGLADLRLDLTGSGDALRVDGRIAVRKGRLLGRGPTRVLPLKRETRAALTTIDAGLAGNDLSFDEARAVFTWRHGKWRLPRIFVSAGTTIVGGQARVAADGDVTAHGSVRLPAELVAGLEPHEPALASFRDESGAATLPFGVAGSMDLPRFTVGDP